jgi:REP element-mobilizing transposase RayT
MEQGSAYIYRRRLPHLRSENAIYFVTWRLHSAQPNLNSVEKSIVRDAVTHFDGDRYDAIAHVVMHDHVHLLVQPYFDWRLDKVVHSWKSWTSHELVKWQSRSKPVWQDEYFDRIVRDEAELEEKVGYIAHNPYKKWPEITSYSWVRPSREELA